MPTILVMFTVVAKQPSERHSFTCIFLQGEGVAYRGRVLVELTTTLNEDLKQPIGVLANEDIIAAQVSKINLT